jgi:hypothetical protein
LVSFAFACPLWLKMLNISSYVSFGNCLSNSLAYLLIELFVSCCCLISWVPSILWILVACHMNRWQRLFPYCSFLFSLVTIFFAEQKLFNVISYHLSITELLESIQKVIGSCLSHKWLICRTYKELKILNTKRINNSINKWANELNSFQKKICKWLTKTWRNVQHL